MPSMLSFVGAAPGGERGGDVPFARVDLVLSQPGVHQTIQRGLSAIAEGSAGFEPHFGLPGGVGLLHVSRVYSPY